MNKLAFSFKQNPQWVFFLIFALSAFLLIEKYMVPWFDEVFYADVSLDFLNNGTFFCRVDAPRTTLEVLIYGPVYFVMSAFSFHCFGVGMWQFRWIGLLSAFVIFAILVKKLSKGTSALYAFLFLILIATDRVVNFNMHSGRMDMLAMFFLLISVLLFSHKEQSNFSYKDVLSGLFLALAALTTIRILFFLPFVIFLPFLQPDRRVRMRLFIRLTTVVVVLIIAYINWIYYAYGSVKGMIEYMNKMSASLVNQHFSGFPGNIFDKLFRKWYEAPKFLAFYISVIYLFRKGKFAGDIVLSFFVLLTMGFILLVDEVGPYRAMVFPFVYFVILYAVFQFQSSIENKRKKYLFYAIYLFIVVVNIIFISARYAVIWGSWRATSSVQLDQIIKNTIEPKSKVWGDFKYYYACKKINCEYVSNNTLTPVAEKFIKKQFRPQYLIVSHPESFYKYGSFLQNIEMNDNSTYPLFIDKVIHGEGMLMNMEYEGEILKFRN